MRSFHFVVVGLLSVLAFACGGGREVALEQDVSPEELQVYEQMQQQMQQQQNMVQQQLDAMQQNRQN